jgi:hypothetical protein
MTGDLLLFGRVTAARAKAPPLLVAEAAIGLVPLHSSDDG